jgi:hypothetical protein
MQNYSEELFKTLGITSAGSFVPDDDWKQNTIQKMRHAKNKASINPSVFFLLLLLAVNGLFWGIFGVKQFAQNRKKNLESISVSIFINPN